MGEATPAMPRQGRVGLRGLHIDPVLAARYIASPQPHITGILAEPGWNSLYLPMCAARGSIVICQMTGISGR